jgi:Domain of unknown function (DUF4336)
MTLPRAVADNVWVIDDLLSFPLGVRIPIRATVVRLADGGLWVHSPTPLTPELGAAVEALGPVRDLVAPSRFHHKWLAPWSARFPHARLWAAPGLAVKRPDVTFAGVLGTGAPPPWAGQVAALPIAGAPSFGEVAFFHGASHTLICSDLVFNVRRPASWMTALILKLMGTKGRFAMSRAWRRITRDRAALKTSIEQLLTWEFVRVIPAHGEVFDGDGGDARAATRAALGWMLR